jgi:hypothetical protein
MAFALAFLLQLFGLGPSVEPGGQRLQKLAETADIPARGTGYKTADIPARGTGYKGGY